jgi:hypothetical protein
LTGGQDRSRAFFGNDEISGNLLLQMGDIHAAAVDEAVMTSDATDEIDNGDGCMVKSGKGKLDGLNTIEQCEKKD